MAINCQLQLIFTDYINDFVADKGVLTCKEPSQALAPTITKLAHQAGDLVLMPTDVNMLRMTRVIRKVAYFRRITLHGPGDTNFMALVKDWFTQN